MRKLTPILLLSMGCASAQSLVQTVNSGSLVTASSSVSVGEIVVVPVNPIQSQSGLIGILTQNGQLEVAEFSPAPKVVAYPNPTTAGISFKTDLNLIGEKVSVFDQSGKLVLQRLIGGENNLDLTSLSSGIYLIQFENKKFNAFKIVKH
ncbi:T9SS type A sorting domain-containing protein [Flavobacterium sp. MAH-1]|uniref:T9SS type A sorting domain-containing protein n=1 Tax=Flavobacterium agri TaxID=2743471 RepID=A0A7Y8Y4X2_9FLAO|nr:T9SS type A sorting domain-containing protein [Flavobacterium agri]NUY82448.1 T9SS type A sorting domain-containing protein [Flavobacterium agri]NYA72472.1 T9SS type A sorting domain-containing protein [Flavobacterium agri]